jgi:hypothetical protein
LARYFIFTLLTGLFAPFSIMAGQPFRTDDPEPAEYHHWEFYCAAQIGHDHDGLNGALPYIEGNYGILKGVQIDFNAPLILDLPRSGNPAYGPGDVEVGLKYRLVNETAALPIVSIYPEIEIPAGRAANNTGIGSFQLFIPLWLQKSWGAWTTYGGGGYCINFSPNQANSLFLGWEGQQDISEALTVGAEIFTMIVPSESAENECGFNIGATINFNENHHFLISAGRDFAGLYELFLFAGYELTIGPSIK